MLMESTADGIQVIKHRATSIQHQPGKGNCQKHIYDGSLRNFMHQ
jgi:hypothetical protein